MKNKTKAGIIVCAAVMLRFMALMLPAAVLYPRTSCVNDGGSTVYYSMFGIYKVMKLHRMTDAPDVYITGTQVYILGNEVYNNTGLTKEH